MIRSPAETDDDKLDGGDGYDQILGDLGNDLIDGGAERDYLDGGPGDDIIHAGSGDDGFYNEINPATGRFTTQAVGGGAGNDTIYGDGRQ